MGRGGSIHAALCVKREWLVSHMSRDAKQGNNIWPSRSVNRGPPAPLDEPRAPTKSIRSRLKVLEAYVTDALLDPSAIALVSTTDSLLLL